MSTKPRGSEESTDLREQRAQWEAFEAVVPTEGIVNICNQSKADPSAHSVFVDALDREAVACSCKDWEHRKPAGGCKHIRFVNGQDALLTAALTPQEETDHE